MLQTSLPRTQLALLPTPLMALPRLSEQLGIELWVKRDDQTGLAFGGNKTRKLEFLAGAALAEGADLLITIGAPQSNHCRQTAAAAARLGMDCTLILMGDPRPADTGNLLLDRLMGAELIWTGSTFPAKLVHDSFQAALSAGRHPYEIPYGGSNPTGITAYVAAMYELAEQDLGFDVMVLASSSGGTQAGLVLGGAQVGYIGRILGISVDRTADELCATVADLATQTAQSLSLPTRFEAVDIEVDDAFLGGGYAVVGDLERHAVARFAQLEGLLLDPVYTGRAAGGCCAWSSRAR